MAYNNNYGKLIYIYDLEKHVLIKDIENNLEEFLKNPNYVFCFKIENKKNFLYNDKYITFDKFPWKTYYKLNYELISKDKCDNTKKNAWNHWITYGKNEDRSFSYINNTNDHRARFGNLFFLNMCLHLFSLKFNIKSTYKYEKEFNELGINFFKEGKHVHKKNLLLTDYNFENLLESNILSKNVIINNNVWFHTSRFCKIIKKNFIENNVYKKIMAKNYYRDRYNNNDDLFLHIRLGDVENITKELLKYFDNTITRLKFNKGYIASDNINHEICLYLCNKYKLNVINENEVKTIMFGSTCKNIILTGGTFSWLIGFFSMKSSNVFYPELKDRWYGDIFSFSNWEKVNI